MEEIVLGNHSEKIRNYMRSIIEAKEPVEKKEFIAIYKKLSTGIKKRNNARATYRTLKKRGLVKFID